MFKLKSDFTSNHKKYGGYSYEISKFISENTKILDIGCTTGKLAKVLKERGCDVTGLDIDPNSLKEAKKYCEKVHLCDLDQFDTFCEVLPKNHFDAITMGDVLEHLKYPGVLLNQLKPYLKEEGGMIIASIPNAAFLSNRLKFLCGSFTYTKSGGLMDEDHLRFFSFKTARQTISKSGYRVNKLYGVSTVRNRYWFLRLLAKVWPTLFAIHIIISANVIDESNAKRKMKIKHKH